MLSSDLVCQRLVERPPKADVSRALGALTLGLAWHGVAVGVVLRKVRDVADRFGVESLLLDAALCAFLTQAFMAVTGNTAGDRRGRSLVDGRVDAAGWSRRRRGVVASTPRGRRGNLTGSRRRRGYDADRPSAWLPP